MENITINTSFSVYSSIDELPQEVKQLMQEAVAIRKKAYAPYSKFRVGAALVLDNGKVVLGSNQENAAYPSGLCAERVAVFHAGAMYPEARILKIAISAASDEKEVDSPIPPCGFLQAGNCRI
jgi:cytidine deaminase